MSFWTSIRRKIRAARGLSGKERATVLRAWFLLLVVDGCLRLLPFPRAQSLVTRRVRTASVPNPAERIDALERAVDMAARNHFYPMTCLRRVLVLRWLLAGEGIATELRIGVRQEEGQFSAHAWLEYEGRPIRQPEDVDRRYQPLPIREAPL